MEKFVKYFGQAYINWLLTDESGILLRNAKSDMWTANRLPEFKLLAELESLMESEFHARNAELRH